jgi:DNA-directed RNA polymerase specialized sigma24 family protein
VIEWARIERWDYIVDSVASEYKRKFDLDYEDIKQVLYQWFVEHPNKLDTWEAIGEKDAKNLIYRSLRNQALDYCQHWKAKSGGYETSDLFFYEADMVEALLSPVLRSEWGQTHKLNLGRPGRPSAPNEGGNMMAMMIEIDAGYWKLPKDDRKLLFYRYAEAMEFGDIAKEMELGSEDTARMRHKRTIRKLINKIGGFKPYRDEDFDEVQSPSGNSDSAGSDHNISGMSLDSSSP